MAILVLHPEQVSVVLEMAAELDLDPQTVAEEMFGPPTGRDYPIRVAD